MIKLDNKKVREIFKDRWRNRRVENNIRDKEPKEEYLVLNGSELVKEGLTYDEALQVALRGVEFSSECGWDYHYQIVKVVDEWVPSW